MKSLPYGVAIFALVATATGANATDAAQAEGEKTTDVKQGATSASPAGPEVAHAQLRDADGNDVGWVRIHGSPNGVLVRARFSGLPEGEHAFHVHEVGKCEPPFESAGGHYNPGDDKHGFLVKGGPHAGDLPNIVIPQSKSLEIDVMADNLDVKGGKAPLLDANGSTFIVHVGQDDYKSQPSGDAGKRIACGVIEAGAMTGAEEKTASR